MIPLWFFQKLDVSLSWDEQDSLITWATVPEKETFESVGQSFIFCILLRNSESVWGVCSATLRALRHACFSNWSDGSWPLAATDSPWVARAMTWAVASWELRATSPTAFMAFITSILAWSGAWLCSWNSWTISSVSAEVWMRVHSDQELSFSLTFPWFFPDF